LAVEVEHVLENHLRLPPKAETLFFRHGRKFRPFSGQPAASAAPALVEFE
jgi:hypothetical protein